jgi:CheY-like chemotaxis protein
MLTYLGKKDTLLNEKGRTIPTILLVEDATENRALLRRWLERRGYKVVEAADGQEALDLAPLANPQLIIMDLRLPKLNGMAVIRRLRRKPLLANIPAIALSGLNPDLFREAALAEGFADYLSKPIDLGELEDVLTRFFEPSPLRSTAP